VYTRQRLCHVNIQQAGEPNLTPIKTCRTRSWTISRHCCWVRLWTPDTLDACMQSVQCDACLSPAYRRAERVHMPVTTVRSSTPNRTCPVAYLSQNSQPKTLRVG
jgi:hypothetical protein